MSSHSLQRILIPDEWLPFSLWYHKTLREKIREEVHILQTELFAFQFRYQCTVEGALPSEEEEQETISNPKKSILHKTFRTIARILHPDRAVNAEDAKRRTNLLAKANAAVEAGDLALLHAILKNHQPNKITPYEEILALKYQVHILYGKKHELLSSSTWSLYQLELQWSEQGRDLLSYLAEGVS
jgi:hypothetical protein